MSLFRLPPSTPQSDLNMAELLGKVPTVQIKRTLAPEWARQSGVQLTWPHANTDWAYMLPQVTEYYLRLAFEIATRETLLIVTPDVEATQALINERLPQ